MNYYEKVRDAVERIAECTTSDAQGIIEAWERRNGDTAGTLAVFVAEDQGTDPEDLARAILKIPDTSTTKGSRTPGPWSVEADKARNNLVVSSDTTGDVICEVVSEPGSDPVAEANARLIAAAPELLEAAAHVLAKLDHPHASVNALDCEMLRKAIAAATNA
jgi:hypothetical protein